MAADGDKSYLARERIWALLFPRLGALFAVMPDVLVDLIVEYFVPWHGKLTYLGQGQSYVSLFGDLVSIDEGEFFMIALPFWSDLEYREDIGWNFGKTVALLVIDDNIDVTIPSNVSDDHMENLMGSNVVWTAITGQDGKKRFYRYSWALYSVLKEARLDLH